MSSSRIISLIFALVATAHAQSGPPTQQPTPLPANAAQPSIPADPAVTQIRKSVAFIQLICKQGNEQFDVRGTGFFIFYPDPRIGVDQGFLYLVTNRHVALCVNDQGVPMNVESISLTLNRRVAENGIFLETRPLTQNGNAPWIVPQDATIDLAALPIVPDRIHFDYKTLTVDMLADHDLLAKHGIAEGEPVFFAGFFYQFPGVARMEPIVRQGIIAMMPLDRLPIAGNPEHLYLADVHAFGGNSGSPAFINLGGLHGGGMILGQEYKLLGVVNGEVFEDEKFNLQLATTLTGHGVANSGISTIVPADEIRGLLDDSRLQKMRDDTVTARQNAMK